MNEETNDALELRALPLRMIAEWVYCPRLFHYMQVEGLAVANEHVLRGRQVHARTDTPGEGKVRRTVRVSGEAGDENAETDDGRPLAWREARAVDLGATALGVVGKLDAVLLDGCGTAIPTEIKSGSGPELDSAHCTLAPGAWDADVVQVSLQGMLLEDAGYTVPRGEIYYRASKTRVSVPLTEALRAECHRVLAAVRAAQLATERPPPLEDSPRCRGCSMVEVCLPDESWALRKGLAPDDGLDDLDGAPVLPLAKVLRHRRLVASAMEQRTVTVATGGSSLRKENDALVITPPPDATGAEPVKPVRVSLDTVDHVALVGNVHATTPCIMACLERGIGVSFHKSDGRLLGTVGTGLASNVALRVAQHAWASDPKKRIGLAREFVRGKLRNQRVLLRRHGVLETAVANEWEGLLRTLDRVEDDDALRGVEGRAARLYFEAYGRLLRDRGGEAFAMDGRNRRPPRDPVNAMLSFGYAIVTRECAEVARRVGFDPMRGFLHGMGWGRPALGLDLVEEFRVLLVDSTVLRVVAEKRVQPEDFHRELQGITLKPGARRSFLQALEQRREEEITHPVFGYRVSYRRAIELQARVLARVLEGEAERYVALTTR
jgi:CRISPR-associated protein Cas1